MIIVWPYRRKSLYTVFLFLGGDIRAIDIVEAMDDRLGERHG